MPNGITIIDKPSGWTSMDVGVVDPLLDDGPRQVLLRYGGDLLVGQLLAQKDMVAVAALYDIADLAGLEGEGGVLELLDKVGVRVDD